MIYHRGDVSALADVFENFKTVRTHKLDSLGYVFVPGYAWDTALFHSGVKLELISDMDILLCIEKAKRGGVAQCSKRYCVANNQYAGNLDESKPEKYIAYFDFVNLYGKTMTEYLPTGGFKWYNDLTLDARTVPDDGERGYFFEVDLKYPVHIHDRHRDLPFCPENRKAPNGKHPKLLATLYDKERYVIHYRYLKLALAHGLVIKKVHRILEFRQEPWLKSFIEMNTELRKNAANEFEKNLFKFVVNSVYGKTMENVRNHSDIRLLTDWKAIEKLVSKPNFYRLSIFDQNLVAIEMRKTMVRMFKPVFVGVSVLDISKTFLYKFLYDFLYPSYGEKVKLAYTDTDSLILEITGVDMYKDIIGKHTDLFDTSGYDENNEYGIVRMNEKVLGKMKDEFSGEAVLLFICVRAKSYAIVTGKSVTKHIKGIKRSSVAKQISVSDFENCLFNHELITCTQNCIRSKKHNVYTVCEHKLALNPFDDKRYLIPNSTETLPWGYYGLVNAKKRKQDEESEDYVNKKCK